MKRGTIEASEVSCVDPFVRLPARLPARQTYKPARVRHRPRPPTQRTEQAVGRSVPPAAAAAAVSATVESVCSKTTTKDSFPPGAGLLERSDRTSILTIHSAIQSRRGREGWARGKAARFPERTRCIIALIDDFSEEPAQARKASVAPAFCFKERFRESVANCLLLKRNSRACSFARLPSARPKMETRDRARGSGMTSRRRR